MEYRIVMVGDDIYHHGIKGQKWGVRRYQNEDGSLTSAGKKRYSTFKPGDKKRYNIIDRTVTVDRVTRKMNRKEKNEARDISRIINDANRGGDTDKLGRELKSIVDAMNLQLIEDYSWRISDKDGKPAVKSFTAIGKRNAYQTLSSSQTKALNKVVRDQRVKKGEAVAGLILGGSLAGLTWSYLKDLGLI